MGVVFGRQGINGPLWSLLNACIDLINQQDRQPRSQHQLRSNGHVTWEGGWDNATTAVANQSPHVELAAPSKSPTDGQSMPEVPPHAAPEPPPPSAPRPVAWLKSPPAVSPPASQPRL